MKRNAKYWADKIEEFTNKNILHMTQAGSTQCLEVADFLRRMHYEILFWRALVLVAGIYLMVTGSAHAAMAPTCTDYAAYARIRMADRQGGLPIERAWATATNVRERAIVVAVYRRPRFYSFAFQQEEIDMIATNVFLECEGQRK